MMKRLLALLFALTLLFSCAQAQQDAAIATYVMPEDAQVFYLPYGEAPQPVEGLEAMYALMQGEALVGDLYVLQMANGRALASISCIPAKRDFTAQQLLDMWPQIARHIESDAAYIDDDPSCAAVEECFGVEVLHIRTRIGAGDEAAPLMLSAEGFAFCQSGSFTEIWAVYPQEALYAEDVQKARELSEDKIDLQEFLASVSLTALDSVLLSGVPYQDGKGCFQMMIPADSVMLTPQSTQTQRDAVRESFIQSQPEGADRAFDRFMQRMEEAQSTFIFTQDMQGMIEIAAGREAHSGEMKKTLAQAYDLSMCMEPDERTVISGEEHVLTGYWLRMGELDLQLDHMVCTLEDGWRYEVSVYSAEGAQDVRAALHAFVQSLLYTPPINGLE